MEVLNSLDPFYILTVIQCIFFAGIGRISKDPLVSGIAYLYCLTHTFALWYVPSSWLDLCIEAACCSLLGFMVISQSARDWAAYLTDILVLSIVLLAIEFIDYFLFNSYLEVTYVTWIHLTTVLEIIILVLANNGLLHSYTGGINDMWANIHNILRYSTKKLSFK